MTKDTVCYTSDAQPGLSLGKPHIEGPDETNKTSSTLSFSVVMFPVVLASDFAQTY